MGLRQMSWAAVLGLCLTGVGQGVLAQTPAPAVQDGPMSRTEVSERLNIVPVFTIVGRDGAPVLANVPQEDGNQVQVASFWLDQAQALAVVEEIKKSNPTIGQQAQVIPMSLGYAYQIAEGEKPPGVDIVFQVLPGESEVNKALEIARASGETLAEFPGVPLFYGVSPQGGLLTVEREGVEIIPFFFDPEDLQTALSRMGGSDVASQTKIEVTTLAQVVGQMLYTNAKAEVRKIAFVPARSALEYIQSLPASQLGAVNPIGREAAGIPDATPRP